MSREGVWTGVDGWEVGVSGGRVEYRALTGYCCYYSNCVRRIGFGELYNVRVGFTPSFTTAVVHNLSSRPTALYPYRHTHIGRVAGAGGLD